MYNIVKFEVKRSSELAELNRLLILDERHSNNMSVSELVQRMSQWLNAGYNSYGVEQDGKIICYSLWKDNGDFYYMRQLYTLPEFRGKGVARTLVESLIRSKYSDKPVRLDVLAGNVDAQSFYQKMGFEIYCNTMIKIN